MDRYRLVQCRITELAQRVNALMEQGWKPLGGVSIVRTYSAASGCSRGVCGPRDQTAPRVSFLVDVVQAMVLPLGVVDPLQSINWTDEVVRLAEDQQFETQTRAKVQAEMDATLPIAVEVPEGS